MNTLRVTFSSPKHLRAVQSLAGTRELYDSVSYCNRCGACAQVCPTYRLKNDELFSPRGRNQLLRLALERKFKLNPADERLRETLLTCTLCGRCNQMCAGDVPTAEHVLEMRRALQLRALPRLLHAFLQLRSVHPRAFRVAARTGILLRRAGVIKLLRALQLTRLPGLRWLNHLDDILPARIPACVWPITPDTNPQLIYLPSPEAEFILPDIAQRTLQLAQQKFRTTVWRNTPCGLFDYVYGDLRRCRRTLRKLLARHAATANGAVPVLTDSIDVFLFLKRAPQLFAGYTLWENRARRLADAIRFVSDVIPPHFPSGKKSANEPVLLEPGALFERQGEPFTQVQQILYTFFGKNLVECFYTDADVPAFGYVFVAPKTAAQTELKAVTKIARTQAKQVIVLSGWAAIEVAYLLKKFYPAARVTHFVNANR